LIHELTHMLVFTWLTRKSVCKKPLW